MKSGTRCTQTVMRDEEDLDQAEMEEGIRALEISTVEEGPAPAEMKGACSEGGGSAS